MAARYHEEAAPADPCKLGKRILEAINDEGAFSVEVVAVNKKLKLRVWDGERADGSNTDRASPNKDY